MIFLMHFHIVKVLLQIMYLPTFLIADIDVFSSLPVLFSSAKERKQSLLNIR